MGAAIAAAAGVGEWQAFLWRLVDLNVPQRRVRLCLVVVPTSHEHVKPSATIPIHFKAEGFRSSKVALSLLAQLEVHRMQPDVMSSSDDLTVLYCTVSRSRVRVRVRVRES